MQDIRRAILKVHVSLPIVRLLVQDVSEQAIGVRLIRDVLDQQLVKMIHDEPVKLMGGSVSELVFCKIWSHCYFVSLSTEGKKKQ